MFALLKLVGVPAETVGKLHNAVKKAAEFKPTFGSVICQSGSEPLFFSVENSKLDTEHGTYTVTLKINWSILCKCHFDSAPWSPKTFDFKSYFPSELFASIMQSIDQNIMNGDEQRVAVDEKSAEVMLDHERVRLLKGGEPKVQELLTKLVGKTLTRDLCFEDGKVFRESGSVLVENDMWSLNRFRVSYESEISLDGQDDTELVSVLTEVKGIYQAYQDWKKEHGFTE